MRERGWTAYRLAKEAGLTPSTVYKILKHGDISEINVRTLEALARALGVSDKPWSLLRRSDD